MVDVHYVRSIIAGIALILAGALMVRAKGWWGSAGAIGLLLVGVVAMP